jgi:transcriptional regulator with XRE-family HTH domain
MDPQTGERRDPGGSGERLQDLIRRRMKELRLTQQDLVERSRAAGYEISRPMWHKWTNTEWKNGPLSDPVRGIAAALEVSTQEVHDASGISTHLRTHRTDIDPDTHAMVVMFQERSPEERAALADMLRSAIRLADNSTVRRTGSAD